MDMIMDSDLMGFMRMMDSDMIRMLMVMLRMLVGMSSLYIMTSGDLISCCF